MNEQEIISFVSYVTRCNILREAARESCVFSTRLVCDTLARLGITTIPIVAHVDVLNAKATEIYLAEKEIAIGVDPEDEAQGVAIAYKPELTAKVLAESEPGDPGPFYGHVLLVALGKEGRYLVDPSIDQATRRKWDIECFPLCIQFPDEPENGVTFEQFMSGERTMVQNQNGTSLYYIAHTDDTTYTQCGDWEKPDMEGSDFDCEECMAQVLGLVELAEEYGEFPRAPVLPTSVSASAMDILRLAPTMEAAAKILSVRGHDVVEVAEDWASVAEEVGLL